MSSDEGAVDASRAERERHGQPEETPGEARRRLALAHVREVVAASDHPDIDVDYLGTVLAEAQATDAVRAEFAAFRAKVVKVALREGERRGWCEEIYDVLRRAGFSDEELPLTHVKVRLTLDFRVKLPRVGDLNSLGPSTVEMYVRDYFQSHDLRNGEFEIITKPREAETAV